MSVKRLRRALAWDGTDLWMVGSTRERLTRLNRTTGVGTELGTAGFGVGEMATDVH